MSAVARAPARLALRRAWASDDFRWRAGIVFGRTTAIAAALGVTVMPGQLIIGNVALSETLYTLMLVGFIALATLLEWRPRTVVLLGVLAGLAALTRGEGFLFPVIVLAMWWWRGLRRQAILRA